GLCSHSERAEAPAHRITVGIELAAVRRGHECRAGRKAEMYVQTGGGERTAVGEVQMVGHVVADLRGGGCEQLERHVRTLDRRRLLDERALEAVGAQELAGGRALRRSHARNAAEIVVVAAGVRAADDAPACRRALQRESVILAR